MTLKTIFEAGAQDLRPMTDDESKIYMMAFLTQKTRPSKIVKGAVLTEEMKAHVGWAANKDLPFVTAVICKRLAATRPQQNFDLDIIVWASTLSGNVATAVLWAHAIAVWPIRFNNGEPVTLEVWAMRASPNGVPTEDFLRKTWEAQKRPGERPDNALDTLEGWADAV